MATTRITDAELAELASHLRLVVARSARRLRQEADTALSPTLTAALASIELLGPLTPSELAKVEGVKRPTVTRVVAKLDHLGLIERAADPDDRRSSLLSTSSAGRALLKRLRGRKNAFLTQRLRELSRDEHATLERAADLLSQMLELEANG